MRYLLVRAVPTIVRRTATDLSRQAVRGRQPTPQQAVRTLARQASRTLSSPRQCRQALQRNAVVDRRYHQAARACRQPLGGVSVNGRSATVRRSRRGARGTVLDPRRGRVPASPLVHRRGAGPAPAAGPPALSTWVRTQSLNVTRHAAALRPFRRREFGAGRRGAHRSTCASRQRTARHALG